MLKCTIVIILAHFANQLFPQDNVTAGIGAKSTAAFAVTAKNYASIEKITGTLTIRQFIAADGTIFAITWQGSAHPNLENLLGQYAAEYRKNRAQASATQGRARRYRSQNIVVEFSGHMRNLRGRAYAPRLIPAGINVDEIR